MAIIPNDEKFIGLSASVDTTERRSALINAESQAYTMQDITNTVSAGVVNPTSGTYPINKNGVFVDSGLSNAILLLPPWYSGGSLGLKYYDNFSSRTLLELNPLNMAYTFGDASYVSGSSVSASGGVSIQTPIGKMIMGCGISSPTNGVFSADANTGIIRIGTSNTYGIGTSLYGSSILIGSGFNNLVGPSNTATPVRWTKVKDENGTTYWYPLYQ